jgi:Fe-S cluster biogenesis protein NfuA
MENTIKVTTVYAEMTPNPATMKFVADRPILPMDGIAEFYSAAEAKGYSDLALQLFKFPFVKGLFFSSHYVTITKSDSMAWDFVTGELREFIQDYLRNHVLALDKFPEVKIEEGKEQVAKVLGASSHAEPKTELDAKIISILDEYVRPAVSADGGAIHFQSFNEGIVHLVLRGSCSGCPSSTVTLKNGVENLMKEMIPEVKEVVAVED